MSDGRDVPTTLKWIGLAALGIWFMTLGYFGFSGLTSVPSEGDSLAYHLPIAGMIKDGTWGDIGSYKKPLYFYPGMGETFLAGMMGLAIPENLFNVIGWVLLATAVYGVGRRAGLEKMAAVVAAAGVAMWPSVVRLLNNQTVDIWLAVWWVASLWWWEKKKNRVSDWVWLGVMIGMLAGTKVSGLLYAAGMLLVYGRSWIQAGKTRWAGMFLAMIIVGGWWYARNWTLTGNPFYPAGVLGFAGDPNFRLMDWSPWKTLAFSQGGKELFLSALTSEYLIWAGLLLTPLWIRSRWVGLGWINFLVYLILPSWPQNMVSDLRYLFVAFIPWTIAAWIWAKKERVMSELGVMTLLVMSVELTQLDFRPKLWMILLLACMMFLIVGRRRGWIR